METTPALLAGVAVLSLLSEYATASMGMGYGTVLTPLLLLFGLSPLHVVPAVLIGQLAGSIVGGLAHHRLGNITLDFRRDEKIIKEKLSGLGYLPRSQDAKVVFILAGCGIIGALIGVATAVNIPEIAMTTYIGIVVFGTGIVILLRKSYQGSISWKGLVGVGVLSSFNKGISGGGYGPLVTGGQLISGREVRSSVGSTTVAEAVVCLVGFLGYMLMTGGIFWALAAATSIGSVIAGPFAALTVRKIDAARLKIIIGFALIALGIYTLLKAFVF
jgi:uncharacterized membrane protein YfcA